MQLLNSILIVLVFASTCFAQLISYPPEKIMGFRGLDTRSKAPNIPDSRAEDLLNVKLSEALDLRKRGGIDAVNDTSRLDDLDMVRPSIQGIFDTNYSNGNSWTLVFVGQKLKYDNSGTWADITSALSESKNSQWTCAMALDQALCTNDVDAPIQVSSAPSKVDLSTTGLTVTLDKAKDFIWFRNYPIWLNTVESSVERPTRFRWGDVGTINTYQDDNFVDIATFAGDEIIGAAELYGDVYLFLKRSIWRASLVGGDDVFIFKKVIDGIGAVARDSIQVVQLPDNRTAVIFLDELKRVLLFNAVSITDIGSIIQPTLDTLNPARLQYAVSTFDGESYYLAGSTSGQTENDIVFEFNIKIFEWTKHDNINANAFAQVEESTSLIKTYFGNYDSFVYWMDNEDLFNDVDGATGILDSVGTVNTSTITGAQVLIDSDLTSGVYTGAIVRITSGTGSGQESVVIQNTTTSLIITQALSTTPDSTSVYSVGDINSYYNAKHFELGDAAREKSQFLGLLLWAAEESDNEVTVSYAIDFGSDIASETKTLSPASSSLWDVALWDNGTWGTTGDNLTTVKFSGIGNHIQPKFSQRNIDKDFNLYGYNIMAVSGDLKQP